MSGQIILPEGAAPSTPSAGTSTLYVKADGKLYVKDDAGTESTGAATGVNGDITSLTACTALTNTAGVDIKGTNTNDAAAAGYVGEYVSSTYSGTSVSNNTTADMTSISLTAGDWDVHGSVSFSPAATTNITRLQGGVSATSATIESPSARDARAASVPGAVVIEMALPIRRISIASTTTIYLVTFQSFTVSTMTSSGLLQARRVR